MLDRVASLLRIKPPSVEDEGLLFASGKTVPSDGSAGYQPGCIFQHTDGGSGTVLYVNEGTLASCDFNSITDLSTAEHALLSATAGTVTASKAVVVDANKDAGDFRNLDAVNIDAGASGTAGSVDVFPATASKGKLALSCADQTGNTTVDLVAGAMAAARTITLVDPLANADILTGKMSAVARTATADGSGTGTIADAGLLQFVEVTCDNADKIIVLPTPTPGRIVILNNGATGYELRSSTPGSIAINGGSGANAESAIAANSTVIAICISATAWKAIFLDADADVAKVEAAA